MEPDSVNKILEESESLRKKVLGKLNDLPPEDIKYIFEEYSPFFEQQIFEKWREQERFDELIEYILYNYECDKGEEEWTQVLLDLRLKNDEIRAFKLLQGLIAGRSELFWEAVNRRSKKTKSLFLEMAIAEKKGNLVKVLYEYIFIVENKKEEDKDHFLIEKLHRQIKEVLDEIKTPLQKPSKLIVDEDSFWEIINESNENSVTASEFTSNLESTLEKLKRSEISKFNKILLEKYDKLNSWDLLAIAYIVMGGCSDDGFDYFKMWIITQGKKVYEAAIRGPGPISKILKCRWGCQCEGLFSTVNNAFFSRSGKNIKTIGISGKIFGEKWDESELEERYKDEIKLLANRKIT